MRSIKMFMLIAIAAVAVLSSCHTSKRAYVKLFKKELKQELANGKVKRRGDTVRVIYPELTMFDFGNDQVKNQALPGFKGFSKVLNKYCKIDFYINGYTDNVGPSDVNVSLSQRRADNTKTLMEGNGVSGTRMVTKGLGEANPRKSNSTDEGRGANRRVEFVLYENKSAGK